MPVDMKITLGMNLEWRSVHGCRQIVSTVILETFAVRKFSSLFTLTKIKTDENLQLQI